MTTLCNKSAVWWLLLIFTIPAYATIFHRGFFPIHDDLPVVRLYAMEECWHDKQIPCRWTKELGNGYGYPLLNFYPPLPYLVGLIPRAMGLSYIDTTKLLFVLSMVLSAGFMARLGGEFLGRWGGFLAALFYLYGPYHALDLFVRGDLNELWAMAFFPAAMWFGYRLMAAPSFFKGVKLGVSWAAIVLSHVGMTFIMTPVLAVWVLMWFMLLEIRRRGRAVLLVVLSALVGVGLSAFFILPVIFEQQYVHVETLTIGYFNFLAHFVDLKQLFLSRFWGYGASVFGPNDGLSFQIGVGHWIVGGVALLGIILWKKKEKRRLGMLVFCAGLFILSAFMSHWKSTSLWQHLPKLEFLQFPWRFLSLVLFAVSLVAASIVLIFEEKWRGWAAITLFAINLILYVAYFQPLRWFSDRTDRLQFSGQVWRREIEAGIFDYLPKWSEKPPGMPAASDVSVRPPASVLTLSKTSDRQIFRVENPTSGPTLLTINTLFYPGWEAEVAGKSVDVQLAVKGELGLIGVMAPPGLSRVELRFGETTLRALSDWVTLLTIMFLFGVVYLPHLKGLSRAVGDRH